MSNSISINPATGKQEFNHQRLNLHEVNQKIVQAHTSYLNWKNLSFEKRAEHFFKLADLLEDNSEEYALLITAEMGKVITQSRKEIKKCVWICRYYAENTSQILKDEDVKIEGAKCLVTYQPLGVVLGIMPWNYPFYQVIRFAAPILMAGNTGLLKHASNVQGAAHLLEKLFIDAGFPQGVFQNVNMDSREIKNIIENEKIIAVSLTGSDSAGRSVAAFAGANLKKTVLELGGSDAYLILEDADLDKASDLALQGRLQNAGQACIAAKRFVVLEKVYDEFLEIYTKKMKNAVMGDPLDEKSYYGPMAKEDLRNELHNQVQKSIDQGAKLILGGYIPDLSGAYYPATILSDVLPGMEAFENELFGPVASIIRAKDEDHGIELANATQFGLGSGVITSDIKRGEKLARLLQAGSSFVNCLVVSDPRLPFGGVKNSGYGRELSSYGIKEFVNIKTIWIE